MTEQNPSVTVQDIWRGLEGVYKKGLTKAIGVSNWNGEQIERVLKMLPLPISQLLSYIFIGLNMIYMNFVKSTIFRLLPMRHWDRLVEETKWTSAPSDMEDPNVKRFGCEVPCSKTPAQV
ncbi:hypothetical protein OSTOST_19376, partial [Ostertagia ostertagi]